jgi:hypothetical protein
VDETLQVKDIRVGQGVDAQRFIMIRNLDAAAHDAHVRDRLVVLLAVRIEDSDALDADAWAELRGRIREKPGLWRYLRVTSKGLLRIDKAKITAEASWTARPCSARPRWTSTLPTSPAATKPCSRSSGAGVTSSSSSCGRSTTARTSGSSPTCSCRGSCCC